MYDLSIKSENKLAREREKRDKCPHTYFKCGGCGVCRDNIQNEYIQEIDRLTRLLLAHNINPADVILRQ